jgi:DNA-directed RNA polymerase subunit omega
MARVTIEDSMVHCPNIFFLIQVAAKRAHQLQHGATPLIPVYKNKEGRVDAPTVFALREIAAGHVDFDDVEIPEKDAFGKMVFTKKRDYQKSEREQLKGEKDNDTDIL